MLKLQDRVKEVFSSVVPLPTEATLDFQLATLNCDPLDLVEIVQNLEEEFGIKIDDDVAQKWATLGDIFNTVENSDSENKE